MREPIAGSRIPYNPNIAIFIYHFILNSLSKSNRRIFKNE